MPWVRMFRRRRLAASQASSVHRSDDGSHETVPADRVTPEIGDADRARSLCSTTARVAGGILTKTGSPHRHGARAGAVVAWRGQRIAVGAETNSRRSGSTASVRTEPTQRSPTSHPDFGPALARLRISRGLAQRKLAALADIDASTVSRLESGGRGVSREVVERLSQALAATPAEHNELLKTAGFLPEEAVALLDEPDLARFSALLADPTLRAGDRHLLVTYLRLALRHAEALGYDVRAPHDATR